MSLINVTNIKIGNNVCNIKLPLVFQIEFECLENLKHDVEWKVIYITSDGSGYITTDKSDTTNNNANNNNNNESDANNELELDNGRNGELVLDAVCLGPLYKGILEFEFRVNPPNFNKLNPDCVLGMQAILISGNYCDQEFIRIGYYTNNTYDDESLRENPPDVPNLNKIVRCIIDQPRVTRFPIKWDNDDLVDFEGNKLNFVPISTNSSDTNSLSSSNYNSDYEDDLEYEADDDNNSNENELDNSPGNSMSQENDSDNTTSSNSGNDNDKVEDTNLDNLSNNNRDNNNNNLNNSNGNTNNNNKDNNNTDDKFQDNTTSNSDSTTDDTSYNNNTNSQEKRFNRECEYNSVKQQNKHLDLENYVENLHTDKRKCV